ncbi:MAG: hypothetical protein EOM20_04010 [Spartobacteria bacterium]|nr:hypothetical protein [Spartobacteria bacterium]
MSQKLIISLLVLSLFFSGAGVTATYAYDWSNIFASPVMGSDDSSFYKGISLGVLLIAVGGILWLGFKTDMEGIETIQVAPEKDATPSLFVDLGEFNADETALRPQEKPLDVAGRIGVRLYF